MCVSVCVCVCVSTVSTVACIAGADTGFRKEREGPGNC